MSRNAFAEPLEARRLLAIAVAGTAGNDVIRIAADAEGVLVVINGTETRFATDPAGIVVNAGDGSDTLRLADAGGLPVTLAGEAGDDRIEVGGGNVAAARLAAVDVVGGTGRDTLVVDDLQGTAGNRGVVFDNPIDTYATIVAAPGSIIRSDASTAESAVEEIVYGGTAFADEVNVRSTHALVTLTVNSAAGNDAVTIGNDIDTRIKGWITLDGGAGADQLNFDDTGDSFADTYHFANLATFGSLRKNSGGSTVIFKSLEDVSLRAGLAGGVVNNQQFRVASIPDEVALSLFGGSGDDSLYLGDAATKTDVPGGNVTFFGEGDVDQVVYTDAVGTAEATYEVGPSSLTNSDATGVVNYFGCENVLLIGNGAANQLRAARTSATLSVTLNGGAGNDTFRLGNGDIDANILNGILAVGGTGTDTLLLDDSADDVGNDTYTITSTNTVGSVRKGLFGAYWSTVAGERVESVSLAGSANDDTLRVNSATPAVALRIDAGDGNDRINVAATSEGPTSTRALVTIVSGAGQDTLDVNSDGQNADALVSLPTVTEDLRELRIRANGRVVVGGGLDAVLGVHGVLTIAGVLDLGDATLIASGASMASVEALLRSGYAGGLWNGAGSTAAIVSSVAAASAAVDGLGYALADDLAVPIPDEVPDDVPDPLAFPLFSGRQTIAGDAIVRLTRAGDANLDRIVDFTDLALLARNYGSVGTWTHGNFDYDVDRLVNFSDLVLLAQNYNQSLVPPPVVPPPVVMAPVVMAPAVMSAASSVTGKARGAGGPRRRG